MSRDIFINIDNFNSIDFEYAVLLKTESTQEITRVPAYQQDVIIKGIADNIYLAAIETKDKKGAVSNLEWQYVSDKNCIIKSITKTLGTFTIRMDKSTDILQYRIDDQPWTSVANAGSVNYTITNTTIYTIYDPYVDLFTGGLFTVQFRAKRGAYSVSDLYKFPVVENTQMDTDLMLLGNICENGKYLGSRYRLTLSNASSDTETFTYDYARMGTSLDILEYTRTGSNDEDFKVYCDFFKGFNKVRIINNSNPTVQHCSFDFILKQSPQDVGGVPIPCSDYINPLSISAV
jgi:hypothetical protein